VTRAGDAETELSMIVVTGATGNVGRPLVRALSAAGAEVTAVSRRPAGNDLPPGVRHYAADLAGPDGLKAALDGTDALFLLLAGELVATGGDAARLLGAARAGGVRQVVLLSSQGARTRPGAVAFAGLRAAEDAVRQSGLDWTILRPGGFYSNVAAWADMIRARRMVAAPFGDVGLPFVDPADVAAVAAVVLAEGGPSEGGRAGRSHAGRCYELTGPAPVTPREQAGAIGTALGTRLEFAGLSRDEARAQMLRFMPAPVADVTLDILGQPTPGEQRVSADAAAVLGRPPRTFAEWASAQVAAGIFG
jgi:uncharacterized protein YbjT (DUF2867 family)